MLYHRDIGFPESLELQYGYTFDLTYSKHAQEAAKTDRYGLIKLPQGITFHKDRIIEVETEDNVTVTKMVVRMNYPLNNKLDIVYVIIPQTGLVKTVWINAVSDKHTTLNKNKYEKFKVFLVRNKINTYICNINN